MGVYQDHVLPHLLNVAMRNRQLLPYRERTIRLAKGRVLEIGVGSGLNLPLYTDRVALIFGLDPHPRLLAMASKTARHVHSKLIEGSAECIPLEDASVDTVVSTWSLCTIRDVAAALAEIRRVVKPGGQLLFLEHGLAPQKHVQRWQNRLTPIWKHLAGGCHLNRAITSLIENAGFQITQVQTGYMPGPKPITFTYEGSARPA